MKLYDRTLPLDPTGEQPAGADEASLPPRTLGWTEAALLVYFGLRLLFYALKISPYIPPDEVTHFGLCRIFATTFFLPDNSPESYQYGLVTNIPWLYYWIMGKLLHLNFFGIPDLTFLRLLNIPFAFGTIYFVWRLLRLLTKDRLTQILLLTAMTNTMMFSFLSAAVSYDNLTNLLAAMAIYYLLAFFKSRNGNNLAASILCELAGCLTKKTLLPLALILTVLLLVHEVRARRSSLTSLKEWFKLSGKRGQCLMCGIFICLALNVHLYGGNYNLYGSLDPEMYKVLPLEKALLYRIAARDYIVDRFRAGSISRGKAHEMASVISHPGDRDSAHALIENYVKFKENGSRVMALPLYAFFWAECMASGIFGVFGHLQIPNYWPTIGPILILALLTAIAFLVRWRPREASWLPTMQAVVALSYAVFLMYVINYRIYCDTGAFELALQGRYIFPVIGPVYMLASYYLMRLFNGKGARLAVLGMAMLIFIVCDFPFFLAAASPEWYGPPY